MKKYTIFNERVIKVVKAIPKGTTLSYAEVARLVGNPKAARAVGTIMRKNFDETIPCHRVILSDGSVGNYNKGGELEKQKILIKEGVKF